MTSGETERNIPSLECMKQAIWDGVKTKSNFLRSEYLSTGGTGGEKYTFGPWTDDIWFTKSFYGTEETAASQITLDNLISEPIPEDLNKEDEATQRYIAGCNPEIEDVQLKGVFFGQTDQKDVKVYHAKAIEASSLITKLKQIEKSTGEDKRVDTIVKDLYKLEPEDFPAEEIPEDSILKYGEEIREKLYYGETKDGEIENPADNTLFYDFYGPGKDSGRTNPYAVKRLAENLKDDVYGAEGTEKIPSDNTIKDNSHRTTIENGILMESTDYLFLSSNIADGVNVLDSQFFTKDDLKIRYVADTTTGEAYGQQFIGDNWVDIDMRPIDENYPTLEKIKIQYYESAAVEGGRDILKNKEFIIVKHE